MVDDLQEELRLANLEIKLLQKNIASNPNLTEALINVEEDEAERWKKMHSMVVKERDEVVRKNAALYVELQEANRRLASRTSSSSAVLVTPVPASPSAIPPTSLHSKISLPKAKTPSFDLPDMVIGGTPKATSISGGHELPMLPPPPAISGSNQQTNNEADQLREELHQAEARAQRHYDEMREYQSRLQQVEDGRETMRGTSDNDAPDPVPDNPPGLWDRQNGQDASVGADDQAPDTRDWITRISRKEHEKITIKPWPKCQDLDIWRSNVVQVVCVASGDPDTAAWREWLAPAQLPNPDYALLSDSGEYDSNLLAPSCRSLCRTWLMLLARSHMK